VITTSKLYYREPVVTTSKLYYREPVITTSFKFVMYYRDPSLEAKIWLCLQLWVTGNEKQFSLIMSAISVHTTCSHAVFPWVRIRGS